VLCAVLYFLQWPV